MSVTVHVQSVCNTQIGQLMKAVAMTTERDNT